MDESTGTGEQATAERGELIPDHALAREDDDRFDHIDYVERLVEVIEHASVEHTSANIALYGSWGSGKSGVKNRLAARLKSNEDFVYAEFDAFRFGRKPLLRNFINKLAEELFDHREAAEFKRPLYQSTSRPHLTLPNKLSWWQWPLYLLACGLLGLLFVGWVVDDGGFHRIASRLFPVTALIAVTTLLLNYFTTTRTTAPAAGEEEFEGLFTSMLKRKGINGRGRRKLVVFIDELDRCAPSEVASTLESIRTFLGVKGCIFIVAADQQVLEHALSHSLRQTTPSDLANPYYSAGSAYLDKIFQYQLAFPPLRPRRLNKYALELVEGRDGVWADPDVDIEDVISILLPTHIHSPRRVKVLLNGFALTYGVALARARRDTLAELPSRAAELAKLVCLKLEFPLFARDLALDDRLPETVLLAAHSDSDDTEAAKAAADKLASMPNNLQHRARLYANGELPVAQLLSGSGDDENAQPPPEAPPAPDERANDDPEEALGDDREQDDDHGDQQEERTPDSEEREASEGLALRKRHALQLTRYLEKTEEVPGPRSDLIHLESAGAVWNLDPQVAEMLERDARDNRPTAVADHVAELDEETRPKALQMLSRLAIEEVGQDAVNALRALLAAVPKVETPPATVAQQLVGDLRTIVDGRRLAERDLPGALDLALLASDEQLVGRLLSREEFVAEDEIAFHALSRAPQLFEVHHERLVEILNRCAARDGARAWQAISGLDEDQQAVLLKSVATPQAERVGAEFERAEELDSEGAEEEAAAHSNGAAQALTQLEALAGAFLDTDQQHLAELAALPLFLINRNHAREQRFKFLRRAGQLTTAELSEAVLNEIDRFALDRTLIQLQALDPAILAQLDSTSAALDRLGAHLWNELVNEEIGIDPELRAEILRLADAGLQSEGILAPERMSDDLVRSVASDEDLDSFETQCSLALDISELGFGSEAFVATCVVRTVANSITGPTPTPSPPNLDRLRDLCGRFADEADPDWIAEALNDLREQSWLPVDEQFSFELILLAPLADDPEAEKPSLDDLREAVEDGRANQGAVGIWIARFASTPKSAYDAAAPYVSDPDEALCDGIQAYVESIGKKRVTQLNLAAVERAFEDWPGEAFFSAADLARADDKDIADALTELASDANNSDRRRLLLNIWSWLEPGSRKARAKLIEQVFLPIANAGTTGHDLARQRLELVAKPPKDLGDEIVKQMRATAPDGDREKTLEGRLQQVGLVKSKSIFGRLLGR